jgi:hypothetical protein
MKILPNILLVLILLPCFGQSEINQMTDKGQKTGLWVEFHNNGKIDRTLYYEPAERKLSTEEAFFHGITSEKDSIIYYEERKWIERYEYRDNWELKRIVRIEKSFKTKYFYGPNREISAEIFTQFLIDRANSIVNFDIELINNSEKLITLAPAFNAQNLIPKNELFELLPNQKTVLEFELSIEPMDNSYLITLLNDSIVFDFTVITRGFHINSNDFEAKGEIVLPANFVYHRTGNEALLKVFDSEKKKELRTIPLSKEWNQIDLSDLTSGYFWINTINYTDNKMAYIKVMIE